MHHELLGTPLPDTPLFWLAFLVSIAAALGTVVAAVERFLEMFSLDAGLVRRYGGLTLPVAWAVWSALLLYWRFETGTVLVVLLGSLVLAAVVSTLLRRRKR